MGNLGGEFLGKSGLGHWEGGDILATGGGLELVVDGGAGVGLDDLLINTGGDHYLINDAGDVRKINTS